MSNVLCTKCNCSIPEGSAYCNHCGKKQEPLQPARTKSRGNGQGSVYKYKNGTWRCCVTLGYSSDGKPIRRIKCGFKTKKDALAYIPTLQTLNSGMYDHITFAALFEKWEDYYADRIAPITMAGHRAAYKYYADLTYREFAKLNAEHFQRCVDACPKGRRTKENMKSLAMLMYKYAAILQITDHNYAQYIFCGKEQKGTRPAFTLAEVERIRCAVGVYDYADYVYCMIYMGYRPTELLQLTTDMYDTDNNAFVGGIKTTAGKDRLVPVSSKIQAIIDRRLAAAAPYLFPMPDGSRMSEEYFRERCFVPLMAKLEIQDRLPYSCRHTFANMLKNIRGADVDKAKLMGHTDISMTQYYQSSDCESLRNIVNQFD